MSGPIEFLEARIGEDEEWAQAAAHFGSEKWSASDLGRWEINDDWQPMTEAEAQHIARHDPARVLAECAAKREIIEAYRDERVRRDILQSDDARSVEDEDQIAVRRSSAALCRGLEIAVCALFLPYTSHPNYDPAWRD